MGLSSTKTQTKTADTATVAPNAAYAPDISAAQSAVAGAYPVAQANNAALLGQVGKVNDFNVGVMDGKYLEGNPYLQKMIDQTGRDVTNDVSSHFEGAGRYGSANFTDALTRALADNEAKYRYGNYATERGYQDAAGGKVLQGSTIAAGIPQLASSTYADQVAQLLGKYTTGSSTGTSSVKPSLLMALMNAGSQAAGAYAASGSDRRLKREITKIGELDDGLAIYIWRYIWGKLAVGVMADEVAVKRPWALGPVFHGFSTVYYGRL